MINKYLNIVIGGEGFIGINLCRTLILKEEKVISIDMALNNNFLSSAYRNQMTTINGNINSKFIRNKITELIKKESYNQIRLWHLAANSDIKNSNLDPNIDLENTFRTTLSCIELASDLDNVELIFASSSAVYGEHDVALKENSSNLLPISPYGITKLMSEYFLRRSCGIEFDRLYIFRFPNVLGIPPTHGVIYDWISNLQKNPSHLRILGNGSQSKQYLEVNTLLEMIFFVLSNSTESLNIFNLANLDEGITVNEILKIFRATHKGNFDVDFGSDSRGWRGDIRAYKLDVSKLVQLGYSVSSDSKNEVTKAITAILSRYEL
jgi:UDP-glucose 4-epimerase